MRSHLLPNAAALVVGIGAGVFLLAMTPAADVRIDAGDGHYITDFGDVPMCMSLWDPPLSVSSTAVVYAVILLPLLALSRRPLQAHLAGEAAPFRSSWRSALGAFASTYGYWIRRSLLVVLALIGGAAFVNRYSVERRLEREMETCKRVQDAAWRSVNGMRRRNAPSPSARAPAAPCNCPPGDPLCSCL